MNVNLEKELLDAKNKKAKELSENSILKEAQQLLLNEDNEDARILRAIGCNTPVMQLEDLTGKILEMEQLEKQYGPVIEVEHIKKLAVDYRLRFLPMRYFIGAPDKMMTTKIKQFAAETGVSIDNHSLGTKFFVLATPESFSLEQKKIKTLEQLRDSMSNYFLDPVLCYQISDTKYRIVHKWGKEFTLYRRLLGWKWKNPNTIRTFNFFMLLPIFSFLASALLPGSFVTNPVITIGSVCFLSMFLSWIRNIHFLKSGGHLDLGDIEYHEGFFTPQNWNSTELLK